MSSGSEILKDAPNSVVVHEQTSDAARLSRALIELGFASVGIVNAALVDPVVMPHSYASLDHTDAERLSHNLHGGQAVEVMTSHDALIYGVVEHTVEDPVLSLQTILENGVVVETTMRPARAPRLQPGKNAWQKLVAWLNKLVTGDPPLWPRGNWPQASLFVELVDTRDAQRLLDRHCARVQSYQEKFNTTIPSHKDLNVYLAIRLRFQQVMRYRKVWSNVLNYAILVLMALAFLIVQPSQSLMDVLFVLYVAGLAGLAMGLVNRVVLPELGPRPRPLKNLLDQV